MHPVVVRQGVARQLERQQRRQPADHLGQGPTDGVAQEAQAFVVRVALVAAGLAAVAGPAEADGAEGGYGGALQGNRITQSL